MKQGNPMECDLAVIGAGLAGQAAALFAGSQGLKVVQVGRPGVFSLISGRLDLLAGPENEPDPWAALTDLIQAEPEHPYALIGSSTIEAAFDEFFDLLKSAGLPYRRRPKLNLEVATALGTIKTTHGLPEAMWPGAVAWADRRPTLIVGFDNIADCSARLMVSALTPHWPGLRAAVVPWPGPGRPGGVDLGEICAREMEDEANLERLARAIRPLIGPAEYIGLPAVLGLERHQSTVTRLNELLGRPVFEIPTLPPSTPGLRLLEALGRIHHRQGTTLIWDKDVASAEPGPDGFDLAVVYEDHELAVRCPAVILATGRFLGRGLRADRYRVWESIFDLPVSQPGSRSEWHSRDFFDEHLLNRAGLRVDPDFRPIDESGAVFHSRLYAVGSILAGQDWIRQKCGAGLALATAWAAVRSLVRSQTDLPMAQSH
jgi:glycerol-3-phosphate dehydrogenase subunit B